MAPPIQFHRNILEGINNLRSANVIGNVIIVDEDGSSTFYTRGAVTSPPELHRIPDRVDYKFPIEIMTKGDAKEAKGLFTQADIKEGDLIYSVKEPLLNIVNDNEISLRTTCDNCFVAGGNGMSTRHRATSTTYADLEQDANVTFLTCGGCKVLYYCSRACQKAAWKHHHKFECPTYVNISENAGKIILAKRKARFVIRLLESHNSGKLSEAEWAEIRALPTNRESKMQREPFSSVAKAVADLIKEFVKTTLTKDEIIDLFCMMHNNQVSMRIPLIKGCRIHDPDIPSIVAAGVCLEPLLSTMNHSCIPSARIIHEGPELRIRAARDISAGEELTLCCCPDVRDYISRKADLKNGFDIECNCALCQKGDLGPKGALRERVLALSKIDMLEQPGRLSDVERGINEMRNASFGWGAHPMRDLHLQALRGYLQKFNAAECLKLALKIRYLIEPAMEPPASLEERIETLYVIQSFLNFSPPGESLLKELPYHVREIAVQVNFHLRDILARDTERCFGEDSMVARYEKDFAEGQAKQWMMQLGKRGVSDGKFRYVPLGESEEERRKFVTKMNELLKWVGIPALEEKDLL